MKNNIKHTNYLDKLIEKLSDSSYATEILEKLNIAQIDKILNVQKYDRLYDRKGMVIKVKTKDQELDTKKICIDIKEGFPNIEQLYEVIYGVGKDSDIRLIIFSKQISEKEDANSTVDLGLLKFIVKIKNQYPLNIYLVKFYETNAEDDNFRHYVCLEPPGKHKYSLKNMESEQTFREQQFWFILVRSLDIDLYRDYPPPLALFDFDLGPYKTVENLRIKAGWDYRRAFIAVSTINDKNDYLIDWWKTKKSDLKKLFKDYKVDLEFIVEKIPIITVKISDLPVSWLLESKLKEKIDFARMLHRNYSMMIDFMKQTMNKITMKREEERSKAIEQKQINNDEQTDDNYCDCCGKRVSELKPFRFIKDELDSTEVYLSRNWRPLAPYNEEAEKALKEACEACGNDVDAKHNWLINKYGEEKTEWIYDYHSVYYNGDDTWECCECFYQNDHEYYEKSHERFRSERDS
jgi:hypothetical protein